MGHSTPTVSIITAAYPPRAEHLLGTAESVKCARAALAAQGMTLEWIIAVDGPGTIPDVTAVTGATVIRLPMRGGNPAARNVALSRATGRYVMPLDHDDVLVPDGLAKLLRAPGLSTLGWIAGSPVLADGSTTTKHTVTARHDWAPRELEESWQCPFPFHPNMIIARREAALAVGGWPAMTAVQDLGYALALSRHYPGSSLPVPLVGIRRWNKQTTAQPFWMDIKQKDFDFLAAWVNADRALNGLPPVTAPDPVLARTRTSFGGLVPTPAAPERTL